MRTVIFHYHLFKNAGTSLDAAFKENFSEEKGEWVTKEFPANRRQNQEQVKQWIIDNPQAKCFSSHTAQLPPPQIDGVRVLPVLFIRHPIDRIASAYSFETKQPGNSVGAVIARNTDLKGYVQIRIAIPNDGQCQNFHTSRLAQYRQDPNKTALDNAKFALENLYFVGVVEHSETILQDLSVRTVGGLLSNKVDAPLEFSVLRILGYQRPTTAHGAVK